MPLLKSFFHTLLFFHIHVLLVLLLFYLFKLLILINSFSLDMVDIKINLVGEEKDRRFDISVDPQVFTLIIYYI